MLTNISKGLAGLHVLYYSMVNYLSTITNYSTPEDITLASNKLNAVIESEMQTIAPFDYSQSSAIDLPMICSTLFIAASSVECGVLRELKLPSFDSLNSGSFTSYLAREASVGLVDVFMKRLFGDEELLKLSMGSSPNDFNLVNASSSVSIHRAVSNVDLTCVFTELHHIIEDLCLLQQKPGTLLDVFRVLLNIEHKLLAIYEESRGPTGFVDCRSLTFIQYVFNLLNTDQLEVYFDSLPSDFPEKVIFF